VITIFAVQNVQIVTVSVLRISAQMPLAFLVAIISLLGAESGGNLFTLLHRALHGARGRAFAT
jgi:uncharacterized integral membrane protein